MQDKLPHPSAKLPPRRFFSRLLRRLYRYSGLALLPAWLRRLLWWAFWLGYFGFALLILTLRYWVLPHIEDYRGDIEQAISRAAGLPISVAHIDTHWRGLRPHLALHDFRVSDGEGRPALKLETVETDVAWSSLWYGELRLFRLAIEAPSLSIRREADGKIFIAGLQINPDSEGGGFSDWLLTQDNIVVHNASIEWRDGLRAAPPLVLTNLNFVLQNSGERHRFSVTAQPPTALAARLDVRGDFHVTDVYTLAELGGEAYAELDYADLAGWRAWVDYPVDIRRGAGGLRLWLGVADRKLNAVTADIALRDVQMRLSPELPMLDLKQLSGRLSGRLEGSALHDGFVLSAKKLTLDTRDGIAIAPTDFLVRWSPAVGRRLAQGEASVNGLDLDALVRLAAHLPLHDDARKVLADYAPHGSLQDFALSWHSEGSANQSPWQALKDYSLRGRFENLGLKAQGHFPGFAGLTGNLDGNEKGGNLSLKSRDATIELPGVFIDPRLELTELGVQANWSIKDGRADVRLQSASFHNKDTAGNASGHYRSAPDGPGEIDLNAQLVRSNATAVWRYLPLSVGHDVREWLRPAITGGYAEDARLRLKGDLKDFPYVDGKKGIFKVTAKLVDATLKYASDWPAIDNIQGDLLFEGSRMLIHAQSGNIFGVKLSNVAAEIPDLDAGDKQLLNVTGKADGQTGEFFRFIDASPVTEKIDGFTAGMRAEGDGSLSLKLSLPLEHMDDSKIEGDFQFAKNRLTIDSELPALTDLSGRLQFTGGSVQLKEARGNLLGTPLTVSVVTRNDGAVAINAAGNASVAELRKNTELRLFDHLSGSTPWRGSIVVKKRGAEIAFESSLQGIASSLPEPFNKSASEAMPLRFERAPYVDTGKRRGAPAVSEPREQTRVTLGKALNAVWLQRREGGQAQGQTQIERGVISIGETPALPEKGLHFAANLKSINLDFWRSLMPTSNGNSGASGATSGRLPISSVSLRAAEATLFDHPFGEVSLRANLQDDTWQAQLTSKEISGDLSWKTQGQGRLKARLKQLTLNEAKPAKGAIEEPTRELPGLDVVADSFILRGKKLGRLEVQAANETGAWRIEKLSLASPDGALFADGFWKGTSTQLNFKFDVADIGKMLERLGYVDAVKRGTAKLEGKMSWNGAPTQIDYASLDGGLAMHAENGQFNKLEPGIGKLLGILSLQSLPRRVTLDFRDVFSEGFAFDSIKGNVKASHGVLSTQNLHISGPAAKVFMSGEASIPAETQKLRVRVQPSLSDSVAVGAMVLNPVFGLAAWAAQKVLKDPLGQIFAFEYDVTGSWSDPKVDKVQRQAAKNDGQ